jgi:predicted tellurium resistance membrane protein TerC
MEISFISVITLILLEIILSIDNLIFIVTVSERMHGRFKEPIKIFGFEINLYSRVVSLVRGVGLSMAFLMRGVFVFSIDWIFSLKQSLFKIGKHDISYKELIFIAGGVLLIYKSGMEFKKILFCEDEKIDNIYKQKNLIDNQNTKENTVNENIKEKINLDEQNKTQSKTKSDVIAFITAILQILLIDLIFSIDSVLIAIALVPDVKIIMLAVFISMLSLFFSLNTLSYFMKKYQNLKLLAMLFIIGVGFIFIFNGFGIKIDKAYLNASFVFSLIFAICDIIRIQKKEKKNLH